MLANTTPPDEVALNDILDTSGNRLPRLGGWWLWRIDIYYGSTGPTDDTDFYLYSLDDRIDVLGGNGVDQIDNATDNSFYPLTSSQFLFGTEIFDIPDNNSVNNAITYIVFHLYQ